METLYKDIRYGFRSLIKQPAFSAIVIVTLTLGIGANTAIFSLVNETLLRPLAFKDPDQLVIVWGTGPQVTRASISETNFLDYQEQNHVFAHLAAFNSAALTLTGGANPERIRGARVSSGFFDVLGVQPILGRTFLPGEDQGGHDAVVLSYGLWQRWFGSSQDVVGKVLVLDGRSYPVLGVLPANFEFSVPGVFAPVDLWMPAVLKRDEGQRNRNYLRVIGRFKDGVDLQQAQAEMNTITRRLATLHPELGELGTRLVPLKEQIVGDVRQMLLLLLGAVGFVLLIACTNVANLQMARASRRLREFAIRAALGASRRRIVRQLLTESLLLALIGGALGLVLGWWSTGLMNQLGLGGTVRTTRNSLDLPVIAYSLFLSVLTGILFGLAPALRSSAGNLSNWLKDGFKSSGLGFVGQRLRRVLTVSEIALSVVLLVGAGLLLRSFMRLLAVDLGFDTEHILTMRLVLPKYSHPDATQQAAFYTQVTERLGSLPGVEAVGAIDDLPLTPDRDTTTFSAENSEWVPAGLLPRAQIRSVTPDYFKAIGVQLLEGRTFLQSDTATVPLVIMVNQSFARRFFPDRHPVGQRITFDSPPASLHWLTIVGVVQDTHDLGLHLQPEPEIYQPYQQNTLPYMSFVVRSAGNPQGLAVAVRDTVRSLNKNLPVGVPQSMESVVESSVAPRRFNMTVLSVFAILAVVLAAIGIYGVMSFAVTQRTQEIGVRMALGAQRRDVLKLVLKDGMRLTLVGVAIGLGAAFLLTRLMRNLLFGVAPSDVVTFASVTVGLFVVALIACYVPARRATNVDALVALRYE